MDALIIEKFGSIKYVGMRSSIVMHQYTFQLRNGRVPWN